MARKLWAAGGFAAILLGMLWIISRRKPPAYLPIEVLSVDSDGDGFVGMTDEYSFLSALGSCEGDPEYRRMFDMDFDGCIRDQPVGPTLATDESRFYDCMGKDLSFIREKVKANIAEYLEWPDGWGAWLVALRNENENSHYPIQEFTGALALPIKGWIHLINHEHLGSEYGCASFACDTAIAAYKALGYGCLLYASSGMHAYNIYWVGGDWRDLHNWWVLEPQSGCVLGNAAHIGATTYQTRYICFFDRWSPADGYPYPHLVPHILAVDYEGGTVDYLVGHDGLVTTHNLEEPVPMVFDRSLGVPK